jgi:hypothetical protein
VRLLLLHREVDLLGRDERAPLPLRDEIDRRLHEVGQPHGRQLVPVIQLLGDRAHPDDVQRPWQEALDLGPEALIGARLRDDRQDRHEVGEHVHERRLRLLDPAQVLRHADPGDVYVVPWVLLLSPRSDERLERREGGRELAHLQPAGVEDRERNPRFLDLAGPVRDRPPLPRGSVLALEDAVDERALPDAGSPRDEHVRMAALPHGLLERLLDCFAQVDFIDNCHSCKSAALTPDPAS